MQKSPRADGLSGAGCQPPRSAGGPPVTKLFTALLLELQHTPECYHFTLGCGELLSEAVNLASGGKQLIRHESRCFRKIVVSESRVDHEDTHAEMVRRVTPHDRI